MGTDSFLGQGWSFPPQFDRSTMSLKLSGGKDNIEQSINLLIATPMGSRSLNPEFGCSLHTYLFRRIDAGACGDIAQSVKSTLLTGEPRIVVEDVDVQVKDGGAAVSIHVQYVIRQTNSRHNHVFPFSALEGTILELGGS